MGYTQGLNFIVGFLIVCGYSEEDVFCLTVHLALNRRYLLLGFYEEGFPLIKTYQNIFKNVLKRVIPDLYMHLYENI